nr:FeoB-associated Cys-rich membrane protein [Bacillus sp. OV322]
MMINFILGALIIGYASWAMYKFISKSKQGKCGACALKKSCSSDCSTGPLK